MKSNKVVVIIVLSLLRLVSISCQSNSNSGQINSQEKETETVLDVNLNIIVPTVIILFCIFIFCLCIGCCLLCSSDTKTSSDRSSPTMSHNLIIHHYDNQLILNQKQPEVGTQMNVSHPLSKPLVSSLKNESESKAPNVGSNSQENVGEKSGLFFKENVDKSDVKSDKPKVELEKLCSKTSSKSEIVEKTNQTKEDSNDEKDCNPSKAEIAKKKEKYLCTTLENTDLLLESKEEEPTLKILNI